MIVKENNNSAPSDKLGKAGYDAERKVAYYLKMAFGENPQLFILNDLRVVHEDDITAQMDHLVIHQHGIIIIESKSVAGKLQVQDDGQWVRWYAQSSGKDRSLGMPNPIKQAKLQGQTLKRVLLHAADEKTRQVLENFPVDVLVTYSTTNGGVFLTKNRELYPEVCAADAVDDYINKIIDDRAKNAQAQDYRLSDTNRAKLADYLVKIHKPYQQLNQVLSDTDRSHSLPAIANKPPKIEQKTYDYFPSKPTPSSIVETVTKILTKTAESPASQPKHTCHKCKSDQLEVRFGRNYYFKCLSCDENNRINEECPKCNRLLKIRKDRNHFFAECKECGTTALFHSNQ